jgi:single-strand DNA-binding protein
MLNRVDIIGRLGKDPEVKMVKNGTVANFSVACSEKWRDKATGEQKERTEWINVVCWNEKLNEIIEKYLRKGSLVMVTGKFQTRQWEKNGEKRYTTEVVMQGFDCKMTMLDTKGDRKSGGDDDDGFGQGAPARSSGSSSGARGRSAASDMDDEIPFAPEFR